MLSRDPAIDYSRIAINKEHHHRQLDEYISTIGRQNICNQTGGGANRNLTFPELLSKTLYHKLCGMSLLRLLDEAFRRDAELSVKVPDHLQRK